MSKTEFLYLSEPDLIEAGALDAAKCIEVCEEVFRLLHEGDYLMGGPNHNSHGLVIVFPEKPEFENMPAAGPERRFIAMPTYLGGRFHICGEKWYGSNVANPKERGIPRSVLTVTLNDAESCEPLAYMSGNLISSMRTGCIPGVALRYLANRDAEVCSMVGVGPIHKASLMAFKAAMPNLKKVVAMARHPERAEEYIKWAKEELGLEGEVVQTLEEASRKGDVVSIAASPKKPLFLRDEWFKEGATVVLTSPVEADDDFWLKNQVVFDNTKMHMAYYEEAISLGSVTKACNGWGKMYALMEQGRMDTLENSVSMGDVVVEPSLGRSSHEEKQIFVTSGQVVFDIGWGYELYQSALKKNIGQRLKLWDEPHWT